MRSTWYKVKSVPCVTATAMLPSCFLKIGRREWMCNHRICIKHHEGHPCLMDGNDFQFKCMLLMLKPTRIVFIPSFKHLLSIKYYQARFLLSCVDV